MTSFRKSNVSCGWCNQSHGLTHNPQCAGKFYGEVLESHCTPEVHAEAEFVYAARENRSPWLTMEEIININDKRCKAWHKSDKPWTDERWITAIVGELGEMANNIKKLFRADDGSVGILKGETIEHLSEEVEKEWADTMLYMLLLAGHRGIKPTEVIRKVFNAKSEQLGFEERL